LENEFPPEWHAVGRQIDLAIAQIRSGIAALGKANHAAGGLYTQAFFGLSIGLERMAKLAIVADHLLTHDGAFLTDAELRGYNHNLGRLLTACEAFGPNYAEAPYDARPNDPIHVAIVQVLSDFAQTTRYFNLNFLSGTVRGNDPIPAWWNSVGEAIIERHVSIAAAARIDAKVDAFQRIYGQHADVFHHDEGGNQIRDFRALALRSEQTAYVQRYGRMYVLQIVRWLGAILTGESRQCEERGFLAFRGLYETTMPLLQPDKYLLSRKTVYERG